MAPTVHTVHTVMPTTANLVLMLELTGAEAARRRLVSITDLDPDRSRVGCSPVPGHPRFCGQATAYVFLGKARQTLWPYAMIQSESHCWSGRLSHV